jgi:hypothetical protein
VTAPSPHEPIPLSPASPAADTRGVSEDPRGSIKRTAGWSLVGGLTIAALTAVVALLGGDVDDTELRVILTSIGFALSSSTAAVGAAQRLRAVSGLRALGTATMVLSGAAFALLVAGLWTNMGDWGSEEIWRSFGCAALLAIACSHACVVLGARRASDSAVVDLLVFASLGLAAFDTLGGLAPIAGLTDDVDEGLAKLLAATLVLLVLTSVLPPILRRLQGAPHAVSTKGGAAGRPGASSPGTDARREALDFLAGEVEAIANRLDELNREPASRGPEIRREVERLRNLARSFQA